jgi:prepilin peptidase CpaA
MWDNRFVMVQWGVVLGATLLGACTDVRTGKIPNRLSGPLLVAGMAWAAWVGGLTGWLEGLLGAALLATPFIILFVLAGGGAGDAKLMLGAGMWLGLANSVFALVGVTAAGAVGGLAYAAVRGELRPVAGRLASMAMAPLLVLGAPKGTLRTGDLLPRHQQMVAFPYGVAIFTGCLMAAMGAWVWRLHT